MNTRYTVEFDKNLTSKILLKSVKKEFHDGIVELRPWLRDEIKHLMNQVLYTKELNAINYELMEQNDINKALTQTEHQDMTTIIENRKKDSMKRFLFDNYELFKVGYYVRDKSYMKYLEWSKTHESVNLPYREFNRFIGLFCINRRMSIDPHTNERTNLHYWVLNVDVKKI